MKKIILVTTTLFASIATAGWKDIPASDYKMNPPPEAGSAEDKSDFDILLYLQANRTEAQCDLAESQQYPNFDKIFASNDVLKKKEIKKYSELMTRVGDYSAKIADHFKEDYMRDRPYDRDSRVQPCIKKPGGHKAYPSGHATLGAAIGCVLAKEIPEREKKIIATGLSIGGLRVLAGVHHPTDVAAGQDLGRQICERLMHDPDFRKDLDNL